MWCPLMFIMKDWMNSYFWRTNVYNVCPNFVKFKKDSNKCDLILTQCCDYFKANKITERNNKKVINSTSCLLIYCTEKVLIYYFINAPVFKTFCYDLANCVSVIWVYTAIFWTSLHTASVALTEDAETWIQNRKLA